MVIDFYMLSIRLQSHPNSTMAYRRREFIELEIIIIVSPIKFLGVFKLRFFNLWILRSNPRVIGMVGIMSLTHSLTHYGVSTFENSDWFSRCLTITCILREDQYGGLNEATTVSLSSVRM